jgi:Winged helix DNA-binding domain
VPALDLRALNRALLARQWLLDDGPPAGATALDALEHLVGLQAQDVKAPYFQLWARLPGFEAQTLSGLLEARAAVRIVLMRGTIHLVAARDAAPLRALAQPVIARGTNGNWAVPDSVDGDALAAAGRALVEAEPRTFARLAVELGARWPEADPKALAQQIRARVPLVQVPPRGLWGRAGAPAHTSLEAWLGAGAAGAAAPAADLDAVLDGAVRRYLAAFGPAAPRDVQKWSGRTGVAASFARLREELVAFTGPDGRELFDLPDAPRPPAGTPVAPRLVGPFDNLVLSHADTSRVLPPDHKRLVMTQNGLIAGMVLLDGFVAGNWRIEATRRRATLTLASFSGKAYKKADAAVLRREGERLLAFAAPGATERGVAFTTSG